MVPAGVLVGCGVCVRSLACADVLNARIAYASSGALARLLARRPRSCVPGSEEIAQNSSTGKRHSWSKVVQYGRQRPCIALTASPTTVRAR